MDRRRTEESIFKFLMMVSTCIILLSLLSIIGIIITKGLPSMSIKMLTQTPKGGYYLGKEGGILNAIIGSLYIGLGSTLLALLISLPIVLYINIYSKNSKFVNFTRFSFDVLWGIPSIVYGAFGFMIMLSLGLKTSLLGGIITVALLILPIMSRAMDEVVRMVPEGLFEASYSLGATRLETALRVIAKQSLPGILTGILIALGRGIGDTASVLFTAGFTDNIPDSLFRPAATLPLAIFYQLGTPIPEVQERAYASAFILTILILVTSIIARVLTGRYTKHIVK